MVGWSQFVYDQDKGSAVLLDPGLMSLVAASKFEADQAMVPLETTHIGEDIGSSNQDLTAAGEVGGVECVKMIVNLVPVHVEKERQLPA